MPLPQISIMKMVKHDYVVKLYEVLASRTKVRVLVLMSLSVPAPWQPLRVFHADLYRA